MLQPSPTQLAPYRAHDRLTDALAAERPRLTRLCQRLTGDTAAAEDLAQETLLTAWRLRDRVSAPEGLNAWLAAIARNHCRRWARARGADRARVISLDADDHQSLAERQPSSLTTDGDDPLVALERDELAELAQRALDLAPEATRDLLAAVYLAEATTSEAALERGVSEGALRVRLARARQALRQALGADADLRAQLEDVGLTVPASDGWAESRIWCPFCGASHLRYRVNHETGAYQFHCAGRCAGRAVAGEASALHLVRAVSSPKSLLARHCLMLDSSYRLALRRGWDNCRCGSRDAYRLVLPDEEPPGSPTPYGIIGSCPRCGIVDSASAWHLALDTVEAQRFWRRYPRMRALPMRAMERDGRDVIVTGFEAVGASARLEIVSDATLYTVLRAEVSHAG
jgi:RNA polymerase sigma factor (sigma-70 family)